MDVLVRRRLVLAIGLYLALAAIAFPFFRYQIGPDALHYIAIAELYREGWTMEAVNAYASPLISWLLAGTLSLPLDPVAVLKIQNIAVSTFAFPAVAALCRCFRLAPATEAVLLLAGIPFIVFAALIASTPDLLLAVLLSFYIARVISPDFATQPANGLLTGLFGALAYFAKAYAFPFLAVHFPIMMLLQWRAADGPAARSAALRTGTIAALIFAAMAGMWIGVLAVKYGKFMYASTGAFNHALFGPESREPDWFPADRLVPPLPGAFIDHPDPTAKILEPGHGLVPWSPFGSSAEWQRQMSLLAASVPDAAGTLARFSPLSPLIVAGLVWGALRRRGTGKGLAPTGALMTFLLYPVGYLVLVVEQRFLWALWPLLLVAAGWTLERILEARSWARMTRPAFALILALSFVAMPTRWLAINAGIDSWRHDLATTLQGKFGIGGRLASDGAFAETAYLALFLGASYYGTVSASEPVNARSELARHRIDFYLVRASGPLSAAAIDAEAEITGGAIPDLRVYRLRPRSRE